MGIVVDASVTLSWCFPDEQTSLALKGSSSSAGGSERAVWTAHSILDLYSQLADIKRSIIDQDGDRPPGIEKGCGGGFESRHLAAVQDFGAAEAGDPGQAVSVK